MCLYWGIYYCDCGHVRFQLHRFCRRLFAQLQRINDPEQRGKYLLPFDPNIPGCEPIAVFRDDKPDETQPSKGNVVHWRYNVSEPCPSCEAHSLHRKQDESQRKRG
ncbi:uncharacterized protein N7482_000789 [Penicillium canariense]|uniref:Uncharacterized protein n=1 Tax=Penicillium canariense TaxID=189055 RepID=A0A9W9IEK9_9EURO|nr:uncharacterized protein N7482_000789 [Penicillium canariense]KAJ5174912.1 hypothetical protein N7482_000789 [Penicillium canariense]